MPLQPEDTKMHYSEKTITFGQVRSSIEKAAKSKDALISFDDIIDAVMFSVQTQGDRRRTRFTSG